LTDRSPHAPPLPRRLALGALFLLAAALPGCGKKGDLELPPGEKPNVEPTPSGTSTPSGFGGPTGQSGQDSY
jgi:predicted small lipoprotein YifL